MLVLLCSTNKRLSPRSRYTFGLNEVVLTTNFFPMYGAFAFNILFHEVKALYWKLSENCSNLKTIRTHFKCLFLRIFDDVDNRLIKHFLLPSTNLQLQDTLCVLRRKLDIFRPVTCDVRLSTTRYAAVPDYDIHPNLQIRVQLLFLTPLYSGKRVTNRPSLFILKFKYCFCTRCLQN